MSTNASGLGEPAAPSLAPIAQLAFQRPSVLLSPETPKDGVPTALEPKPAVAPPVQPASSPTAVDAPKGSVLSELAEVATDFWHYRELLYQLARRDIRIRYKQAVMGFGWALFMPIFVVSAGVLVRFAMANLSGTHLELQSIAGIVVKALPWSFFVGALGFAAGALVGNSNLVGKVYFPREILPLSVILAQGFDTLISAVAVATILLLLGLKLSFALLWVIPLGLLLLAFTIGAGLFVSCTNLFFRDVKYIVQVLVTFGIFLTPVFFEPAMFGPVGAKAMMLNPLAPILEGLRLAIIEHHNLLEPLSVVTAKGQVLAWSPWYLAYATAISVGGLIGATVMFHRLEQLFAEYV
jgi:homopolymeric O-antigen transport system permease protein